MLRKTIWTIIVIGMLCTTGCETRSAYQNRIPTIGDNVQHVDELYGEPYAIEELPDGMQTRHYRKKIWSPITGVLHGYDTHDVTFKYGKVVSHR